MHKKSKFCKASEDSRTNCSLMGLDSVSYGTCPEKISNRVTPNAYISVAVERLPCESFTTQACKGRSTDCVGTTGLTCRANNSGAFQKGVPVSRATVAAALASDCVDFIFLLKPKSHHLKQEPASTYRALSDLRSPCTIFFLSCRNWEMHQSNVLTAYVIKWEFF